MQQRHISRADRGAAPDRIHTCICACTVHFVIRIWFPHGEGKYMYMYLYYYRKNAKLGKEKQGYVQVLCMCPHVTAGGSSSESSRDVNEGKMTSVTYMY